MTMARMITLSTACLFTALSACSPAPEGAPAPTDLDPTRFQIETVVTGLNHPWGMAFLPDGDLLITERNGGIRLVQDGALLPQALEGGPQDVFVDGQGGVLDIALSPDFATSGHVYISYAAGTADANTPALYRARFDGARLSEGETVFKAEGLRSTNTHYGGRLGFLKDGSLLMTLGEGFAYREAAQRREDHLGALVRLTPDGAPAPGNPFASEGGAAAAIYSYGHRNMQGLAIDPVTGRIWTHEHGPDGGDELNQITPGGNYGWPIATEGLDYNGARISPYYSHDGYAAPAWVWTPSIAPSGLALYTGDLFPDWRGDLLVSALSGKALHHLDLQDGVVVAETRLLSDREQRLRHVLTGPDDAVWLLTDAQDGAVLRLTPAGE